MSAIAYERGARSRRRIPAAALACLLLLAACQADNGRFTGSLGQSPSRAIAFESIDGPPPTVFERLVAQLNKEAEARKLPIVSRSNAGAWRVRLYLAAHLQKKQATISWVGDVFDANYDRAFRVAGAEPVSPPQRDVWALADDAVLAKIAAKSLEAIMFKINAPEVSPAPAEPAGRETPVADAGRVNAVAADRRQSFVSE
ncbi:MAG TPA: hypothetical protein VEH75_00930 [Xanthobacteraceae bacterium]|nr:hypothetical protein [Xanthobacteraceae bacterium]